MAGYAYPTAVGIGSPMVPQFQSISASPAYGAPVSYGAPVTYGAPATYGAPVTYGAPSTYGAPVTYGAPARMATGPSINWQQINAQMPYGQDPEEKRRRNKMFRDIDVNGNGFLSLAEVDKGLRDTIRLDQVFDCKPAIMRAFQAAKNYGGDTNGYGPDYIEKREFRIFLQYLRSYFELYQMFSMLDINGDRRVSIAEFQQSIPLLQQWGVAISPNQVGEVFAQIDRNGGGMILFTEFTDWAIAQKLDLGEEQNRPVLGPGVAQYTVANMEYLQSYAAPVTYAAPATTYAAPVTYGAPATYAQQNFSYVEPVAPVTYAAPASYGQSVTYAAPQMTYAAPGNVTYAAPAGVTYAGPGGVTYLG